VQLGILPPLQRLRTRRGKLKTLTSLGGASIRVNRRAARAGLPLQTKAALLLGTVAWVLLLLSVFFWLFR